MENLDPSTASPTWQGALSDSTMSNLGHEAYIPFYVMDTKELKMRTQVNIQMNGHITGVHNGRL